MSDTSAPAAVEAVVPDPETPPVIPPVTVGAMTLKPTAALTRHRVNLIAFLRVTSAALPVAIGDAYLRDALPKWSFSVMTIAAAAIVAYGAFLDPSASQVPPKVAPPSE